MASDPKTSKVGGGGATDPQSLMNVDRQDRKRALPSSSDSSHNTAFGSRSKSPFRAGKAQQEGMEGASAVGHATAATTLSTPSPPQLQLMQPPQQPDPTDILRSLESSTVHAAHALGSAPLHLVGRFLGGMLQLLETNPGDRHLDLVRANISLLLGRLQSATYPSPPPLLLQQSAPSSGQPPPPQSPMQPRLLHATQPTAVPKQTQSLKSSAQPPMPSASSSQPPPPPPSRVVGGQVTQPTSGGRRPTEHAKLPLPSPLSNSTQPSAQQRQPEQRTLDQPQPPSSSSPSSHSPPVGRSPPVTAQPTQSSPPPAPPFAHQQRRRHRGVDVGAFMKRTIFRLHVPASHPITQIRALGPLFQGVKDILKQHSLSDICADIEDVFRRGSAIFFRVRSHFKADQVVRRRCCLKGTGFTIFDVFSAREEQQHSTLMPRFYEAVAEGKRAQFSRHRLKIDGQWV